MNEDQTQDAASRIIEALQRGAEPARKSFFDLKLGIGHLLVVAGAVLGFWLDCKVSLAGHEARLSAVEQDRADLKVVKETVTRIDTALKYIPGYHQ